MICQVYRVYDQIKEDQVHLVTLLEITIQKKNKIGQSFLRISISNLDLMLSDVQQTIRRRL